MLTLFREHGLPDPEPDRWYDGTRFQDAIATLGDTAGPTTLRRLGRAMATGMEWPDVSDAAEAFASLETAYGNSHRGDAGGFDVESTGERTARVHARTPYPEPFVRGLLKGVGYAFSDGVPRVIHAGENEYRVSL
jgi:hypothetical protein